MSGTLYLSTTQRGAIPELHSTLAERQSGDQDILDAAQHYRRAELLAWRDAQARPGLAQMIASNPDLERRVIESWSDLKREIAENFLAKARADGAQGPKAYEIYHELMLAHQCFTVHMAEASAMREAPAPEDAARFARARLGMSLPCREFYESMNLIAAPDPAAPDLDLPDLEM